MELSDTCREKPANYVQNVEEVTKVECIVIRDMPSGLTHKPTDVLFYPVADLINFSDEDGQVTVENNPVADHDRYARRMRR
jgi:hypothetical protein